MKLYLVSSGSYSDYQVHSIWSTKEKAEEVNKYLDDQNYVEEFELDAVDAKDNQVGWELIFKDNGDLERQILRDSDYWDLSTRMKLLHVCVKTTGFDPMLALKIATDKRAKYLAEKKGLA